MKKGLILLTLLLALGMGADAASQKHRHHATTSAAQVDSVAQQDAIEAFSDTTAVADSLDATDDVTLSDDEAKTAIKEALSDAFSDMDGKDIAGILTILGIIFIIFFGFPLIILIGIIYLIRRNRKDKLKMAQMAMQNGQPIPDRLLEDKPAATEVNDEYQKGLRQMFVGIGLAVFLGLSAGQWGFGIGALVFFIGLGKVAAAKTGAKHRSHTPDDTFDTFDTFDNNQQ